MTLTKRDLDALYVKFNKRKLVDPDPLVFLYAYDSAPEREIVGLLASSLAYGRVAQILKSIRKVLDAMGDSPIKYLKNNTYASMLNDFNNFKHRFTTGKDLSQFLCGVKIVIEKYGSLENCFCQGLKNDDNNILPAMESFVDELTIECDGTSTYLLPRPSKGSACKRLNLFLRWMIRKDEVDPGDWTSIPSSLLLIPLDTHMKNICTSFGMTQRKNSDMKTVLEITEAFRSINPKDPVKYDFALTRFGIRDDMNISDITSNI